MIKKDDKIVDFSEGLFGWYEFKDGSTVINIQNEDELKRNKKYDYIISIGGIERTRTPKDFLVRCKKSLKPDGHLMLAFNNRFGLKFFCGDRDPYTERNFDGIENYRRVYTKENNDFNGRCYSKSEIRKMIADVGFEKMKFYSVLTDMNNPSLIYAEDYMPNEDLSCRIVPTYDNPETIFLEESTLYEGIISNGMFHSMANAYLVECTMQGILSDVSHITSSIERGKKNAIYTIIHGTDYVEKKAVFEEGKRRILEIFQHERMLSDRDIPTVKGKMFQGNYVLPFIKGKVGHVYLKELLYQNKEDFLRKLDTFKDAILRSSNIISEDVGNGHGAVLEHGFIDMVPLNSFYVEDKFVFFDQEFLIEKCPANAIIYRMISSLYSGDRNMMKIIPVEELYDRYGLSEKLAYWESYERDFLNTIRREKELKKYNDSVRANYDVINSNRVRMNYSVQEYQRYFVDIFNHADTRKLFLFGAGNYTKKFLTLYGKDYSVDSIIDNNSQKWGTEFMGIKVQSSAILKEHESGEYKVIICVKNYLPIMKQLEKMGIGDYAIYDWDKDYPRKLTPLNPAILSNGASAKKYHIGYVAGAFDMFHIGHVRLLQKAKEMCDYLIVGIIEDETIYKLKHKRPVISCQERVEVVASCKYADQVEALPEDYSGIKDAYKMFHFDVQFSGDDHGDEDAWLEQKKYLRQHGADIVFLPYTKETSSTIIRSKLEEGK